MTSKDIAIKIDGISKIYRIGMKATTHDNLVGAALGFLKTPLKNYRKYRALYKFDDIPWDSASNSHSTLSDIIWALEGISFEVKVGETLGIIGRNGAGKSTLLKILSRITDPTSGRIEIRGRNSSLLEVGTGFHPELTGRENVYLNGTVLGMKKREVDDKFDEIVDFSGVEKFIDTPVKRYSSGMSMRLAFAVAAHLDPEILIVDEVLAVGDADFQAKCIGKMSSVAKGGRTVLFVSHNMGAITELCTRTLWLEDGHLKLDGPSLDVVPTYLSSGAQGEGAWVGNPPEDSSGRRAWLTNARVIASTGDKAVPLFRFDEQVKIEIRYEIVEGIRAFRSYFLLRDSFGNILWASHDTDGTDMFGKVREPGTYRSECVLPERMLRPGRYYVSIGIFGKPRELVAEEHLDIMSFQISDADYAFNLDRRMGLITPFLTWNIERQRQHNRVVDRIG